MNIPIFISTDKNYVIPSITLIASVMENTKENCNFYILNSDLDNKDQNYIQACLQIYKNLSIEFVKIDETKFQNVPLNRHFKISNYYRFLIPEINQDINKAIYLDVDMVADFDIKELFTIDLENKPLAAASEKCMDYITYFMEHCMLLNISSKNYFNSGVLVMNLKYIRDNNIVQSLFKTLENYKDKIICVDQDIFNLLFCDNYRLLPYKYNCNPALRTMLIQYADPDLKDCEDIKIYHFAGEQKPWNTKLENEEIWFKYANKVINSKDLGNFCKKRVAKKQEKQKILSIINEYDFNTKYKNLYLCGLKIPVYKKQKTEKYLTKHLFNICYSKKPNPDYIKLIMTIVCKNEDNIIEQQIRFHKEMGIDGFIVLDHNSTDNTPKILDKLKNEGIIYEIIKKTEPQHEHHIWVEEMIKLAKEKYGATWVINADADEFYFSKSLNLKESIKKSGDVNALLIHAKFLYPDNREDFLSCPYFITKPYLDFEINQLNIDETSHWLSNCAYSCSKVIHKTEGFISIEDGNHNVKMKKQKMIIPSDISYYHYHIKNYKEYENKTKRWIEAMKYCPIEMNKHLLHSIDLYRNCRLYKDYENKYGEQRRNALILQGVVTRDLSIYNFLKWKGII